MITNTHDVAIKILSGYATYLSYDQKLRELEVLQRLSSSIVSAFWLHSITLVLTRVESEPFWFNVLDIQATLQGGFHCRPDCKADFVRALAAMYRAVATSCGIYVPP